MRFAFYLFLAMVTSVPAAANHLDLTRPANVTFACESADSMTRLILAKDDTEADAILAGAHCFAFGNGIPARIIRYVGDARDPMAGKMMEVYEVETIYGDFLFTYLVKPGIDL